jgi:hypothetical protein
MKQLLVGIAFLVGCGIDSSIPQCMQDLPKSEEEAQKIVQEIRQELGPDVLVEQVEEYFFVATNDTPAKLGQCKSTLRGVVAYLYEDFFTRRPEKPIRVYLFNGKHAYDQYCVATYEKPPTTPFGFYMSRERKIVTNIATGTGTLAHELVHPLLADDFPNVPSWFNEGFASLFEHSGQRDGKLVGFTNWRLPGLQKAIRAGKAISLLDLVGLSADQFYGEERGVNYATARYLCMYLQESGLLARFYREFRGQPSGDRTGAATLAKVTGRSLDELDRAWKEWVQGLPAPE